MNEDNSSGANNIWRKMESLAKLLGGIGAILGAVLIPVYLNKQTHEANLRAAEDRKVQVYAQIMSQREAKDTEIRAKMFETLLSNYIQHLGIANSSEALSVQAQSGYNFKMLNQKIIFLNILMENFMEYFNASPLFKDLYMQISQAISEGQSLKSSTDTEKLKGLRAKLIDLCKHFASKEVAMLSRMGLVSGRVSVRKDCESSLYIPLFEVKSSIADKLNQELENPTKNTLCEHPSDGKEGTEQGNKPADDLLKKINYFNSMEPQADKKYYAIGIKVDDIKDTEVRVSITLFECRQNMDKTDFTPVKKEPFVFSVSYFDMPYMDNTRLFEGQRFAIILKSICSEGSTNSQDLCLPGSVPYATFQVVTFKEEFMSLRDRPLFEDMLNKLKTGSY